MGEAGQGSNRPRVAPNTNTVPQSARPERLDKTVASLRHTGETHLPELYFAIHTPSRLIEAIPELHLEALKHAFGLDRKMRLMMSCKGLSE